MLPLFSPLFQYDAGGLTLATKVKLIFILNAASVGGQNWKSPNQRHTIHKTGAAAVHL